MSEFFLQKKVLLIENLIQLINNRKIMAAFHIPILGGFLTLIFGLFIFLKHKRIRFEIKEAIAAQIIIPFIFSAITFASYAFWFFGFDFVSSFLSIVSILFIVIGYGMMFQAAFKVWHKKNYSYYFFNPFIKYFPRTFFGSEK